VVGALVALDQLQQAGFVPSRPVGVVNFADEEGSRFGVACAGSRVITGALGADRARGLTDSDGVTMAEAMRRAGRDPVHLGRDDETLARIGTFVELHVEQGRHLVELGQSVGVGSDIWPHGRWRVDVPGEANHAGTTRLDDREDALLGLAAMVIAARRAAEEQGCVATVGKVHVVPGGVNAIASRATGWLDARGTDPDSVLRVVAEVRDVVSDFDGLMTQESWTPTTDFDPALVRRMASRLGGVPVIGTGAGHDAGILANDGIRSAMLFVRNPTGVSHSPDEWASADDCLAGIAALADVVTDLAGAGA
jgi:N-carbamoyl-L-amino-acid hydrolase